MSKLPDRNQVAPWATHAGAICSWRTVRHVKDPHCSSSWRTVAHETHGAGKKSKEKDAAETQCYELTTTPIPSSAQWGGFKRSRNKDSLGRMRWGEKVVLVLSLFLTIKLFFFSVGNNFSQVESGLPMTVISKPSSCSYLDLQDFSPYFLPLPFWGQEVIEAWWAPGCQPRLIHHPCFGGKSNLQFLLWKLYLRMTSWRTSGI